MSKSVWKVIDEYGTVCHLSVNSQECYRYVQNASRMFGGNFKVIAPKK